MLFAPCAPDPDFSAAFKARGRLLDQAIAAAPWTITNVQSPPGYGKSALLETWRQSHFSTSLFLDASLLPGHAAAFAEAISHALATDVPATGEDIGSQVADQLEAAGIRILIVSHYPAGQPLVDAFFLDLLQNATSGLHLILASRAPIALALRGDLRAWASASLTPRDLALTCEEVASALAFATNVDATRIHECTDGWPWAVSAACLLAEELQDADAQKLMDRLSDPDGRFATAIFQDMLSELDTSDLEILTQATVLDVLDPDAVAAVSGCGDAWRILERLQGARIVEPCQDVDDGSCRCQPLIRAVLRRRLATRGARAVQSLHQRAAEYFARIGASKPGLRHAVEAGDADLATRVFLAAGGIAIGLRDGYPELQASLDLLPAASLANPRARIAVAALMIKSGRWGIGLEILREVTSHDALDSSVEAVLLDRDIRLVELLAIACGISTIGTAESRFSPCLESSPAGEHASIQGVIYNLRCLEALRAGNMEHGLVYADTAAYYYEASGARDGLAHIHLHRARLHRARGHRPEALRDLEAAKHILEQKAAPDLGALAHADIQLAAFHAEQGDFSTAAALCDVALTHMEAGEPHWEILYEGYATLGVARDFAMERNQGGDPLRRGLAFAEANEFGDLTAMLRLRLLQLAIFKGAIETQAARATLKDIPEIDHWMVQHARTSVSAHLLALEDRADDALELLADRLAFCRNNGLALCAVENLLDQIVILDRAGRRREAMECLHHALAVAKPARAVAPFVDRREVVVPILTWTQVDRSGERREGAEPGFGSEVLGLLIAQERGRGAHLSVKERAIMSDLAEGRSNKEIARNLQVSPETIRFHLKNVYSKLGINAGRSNRQITADFARMHAQAISLPLP